MKHSIISLLLVLLTTFAVLPGQADADDSSSRLTVADLTEDQIRAVIPRQGFAVESRDPESGKVVAWQFDPTKPDRIRHNGQTWPNDRFALNGSETVRSVGGHEVKVGYHERDGQRYYLDLALDNARWRWIATQLKERRIVEAYSKSSGPEKDAIGGKIVLMLELLADRFPHYLAADRNPALGFAPPGHAPFNVTEETFPFDHPPQLIAADLDKGYGFAPAFSQLILALDDHPALDQKHESGKTRRRNITEGIYLTTLHFMDGFGMHRHIRGNWNFHLFDMVDVARELELPELAHFAWQYVIDSSTKFHITADGVSLEGTGYHWLWESGPMRHPIRDFLNYEDPPGYVSPRDGLHIDRELVIRELLDRQSLARVTEGPTDLVYPNGRWIATQDTNPVDRAWNVRRRDRSINTILPSYGVMSLGDGEADQQVQAILMGCYSDNHRNDDSLNFLMFGFGRALHDDNTCYGKSVVAHNTVAIDRRSAHGSYRRFDIESFASELPGIAVARMRHHFPYRPQDVKKLGIYRRTIIHNTIDLAHPYVVDVFEVSGGTLHDYFLHGAYEFQQKPAHEGVSENLRAGLRPMSQEKFGGTDKEYGRIGNLQQTPLLKKGSVDFRFADKPGQGSRAHLFDDPGTTLIVGDGQVIGGGQNVSGGGGGTVAATFPQLVLRSEVPLGTRTVFVVVHEPLNGTSHIGSYDKRLLNAGEALSLAVTTAGGRTDRYLVSLSHQKDAINVGQAMSDGTFRAEAVVAAASEKGAKQDLWLVDGKRVSLGERVLEATVPNVTAARVIEIQRGIYHADPHSILTDAALPEGSLLAGQTLVLELFDPSGIGLNPPQSFREYLNEEQRFLKVLTIDHVQTEGENRRVFLRQDPGLEWEKERKVWTEVFSPFNSAAGLRLHFRNQATTVPQVRMRPDKGRYTPNWTNGFVPFDQSLEVRLESTHPDTPLHLIENGKDLSVDGRRVGTTHQVSGTAELRVCAVHDGVMQARPRSTRYLQRLPARERTESQNLQPGLWRVPVQHRIEGWNSYVLRNHHSSDLVKWGSLDTRNGRAINAVPGLQIDRDMLAGRGAVFSGYINAPASGEYEFSVFAMMGAVVYIDGEIVLDAHERGCMTRFRGKVYVEEGLHRIRVDHTMTDRWRLENTLRIWWKTPDSPALTLVPDARLLHDASHPADAPRAIITIDDATPAPGQTVRFDATRSFAWELKGTEPGSVKTVAWNLGADGTVESTERVFTHTFDQPGRHRVRLTVTDQKDRAGTDELLIEVE